jgi:chorismate mutase-like protein
MAEADDREQELARHRAAIDAIDREILADLNARAAHAKAIGTLKEGGAAYRPEREAQVLARLQKENRGPLPNEAVAGVFRQVMSACLALEQPLRVAYLGPAGTFSHAAVAKHFGKFVHDEPYATIDEVFRAAEGEQTDYAVVPVENSTEGAVGRTLDLMCQTPLSICGETSCACGRTCCRMRRRSPTSSACTRMRNRSRNACSGSRAIFPPRRGGGGEQRRSGPSRGGGDRRRGHRGRNRRRDLWSRRARPTSRTSQQHHALLGAGIAGRSRLGP